MHGRIKLGFQLALKLRMNLLGVLLLVIITQRNAEIPYNIAMEYILVYHDVKSLEMFNVQLYSQSNRLNDQYVK